MEIGRLDFRKSGPRISAIVTIGMLLTAVLAYAYTGLLSVTFLIVFGFSLALIDNAFGMGFGTIGTPALLILGFSSITVVPAVLFAQFLQAGLGSILHHRFKNVNLLDFKGRDFKLAFIMTAIAVIGAVAGVALAIRLPGIYVKLYIGCLVAALGIVVLIYKKKFNFSWKKFLGLSMISGFNKAMSGGGYGPVSTSGLLVSGNSIRNSVGIAIFSVVIVNLVAFVLYVSFGSVLNYLVIASFSIGAVFGSQIGPRITSRMREEDKRLLGILMIVLGFLTILAVFYA